MSVSAGQQPKIKPSWPLIMIVSAIAPIILAVLALLFWSEVKRSEGTRHAVENSVAYQRAVEGLLSQMKDAETGQRGYLLTGDASFLAPYESARRNVGATLLNISQLSPNDNERDFVKLRQLVAAKFAEMKKLIRLHDDAGPDVAAATVAEGLGKRQMDAIRVFASRLHQQADANIARVKELQAERITVVRRFIWSAIVSVAIAAGFLGLFIGRSRRQHNLLTQLREEAAARQRAIFDNVSDAIILINPSGSIEKINTAAERMFGYEAADVLRRDISTLIDIAPGEGAFLERIGVREGQLTKAELMDVSGRDCHGEPVSVDVVLGTMLLPDGLHIIAALRDAANRKEIDRLKDDFISTVSHELRTPLTSVVGSLTLLRSGAAGALPTEAQRLTEIAENNSQRLIRLINDILDIDQIRKGRMAFDYAVVDLRDVMTKTADAMQGLASRRLIRIETSSPDHPVIACVDTDRLVQVAGNLLSNAIKFSPEESVVHFDLIAGSDDHVIQVTDQGPGITPEFAKNIFNRFARGNGSSRQGIAGTGLGLAISREIVRSHGGDISFENRAEGGARFAFSIPRDTTFASETCGQARLLICEDDSDAGRTIQSILTAHGYSSDLVGTVREAIAHARSHSYAAVLLDLALVEADSSDVIQSITSGKGRSKPPIIGISGLSPPADLDGNIYAGWLQKPFDPPRLLQLVQRAIRRVGQRKAVILHIDDDSDTRELFASALAGRGLLLNADSLASARAILAERRPDAIVLDLGLPDGSGHQLLNEVKSWKKPLPVIVYSAQEMDDSTRRLADAVIVKSRRALPKLASTALDLVDQHGGPQ